MIQRELLSTIRQLMLQFPAVGILGPRQIGKTTLALQIAAGISPEPVYLDLESVSDLAKLREPELYFNTNSDRTIILWIFRFKMIHPSEQREPPQKFSPISLARA